MRFCLFAASSRANLCAQNGDTKRHKKTKAQNEWDNGIQPESPCGFFLDLVARASFSQKRVQKPNVFMQGLQISTDSLSARPHIGRQGRLGSFRALWARARAHRSAPSTTAASRRHLCVTLLAQSRPGASPDPSLGWLGPGPPGQSASRL